MQNKNEYEIVIHGRGGQGVKTTAEILAQVALLEGKNVQAFPEFGPERSGAPVKAFVRISDKIILTHEPIINPDCVLVLDETLINETNLLGNLTSQETLIVNTKKSGKEVADQINFKGKIVTVDASGISKEIIGQERPNTVILGRFAFITEKTKIENIVKIFKEKYQNKIGEKLSKKNIVAIIKAYDAH